VCRDISVTKVNKFNVPHVGEEHFRSPSCFDQISDSPSHLNNWYRVHYEWGWPSCNDKWMVTNLTAINGIVIKCTYRNRERSLRAIDSWPSEGASGGRWRGKYQNDLGCWDACTVVSNTIHVRAYGMNSYWAFCLDTREEGRSKFQASAALPPREVPSVTNWKDGCLAFRTDVGALGNRKISYLSWESNYDSLIV
jgi:hypothetical protein